MNDVQGWLHAILLLSLVAVILLGRVLRAKDREVERFRQAFMNASGWCHLRLDKDLRVTGSKPQCPADCFCPGRPFVDSVAPEDAEAAERELKAANGDMVNSRCRLRNGVMVDLLATKPGGGDTYVAVRCGSPGAAEATALSVASRTS